MRLRYAIGCGALALLACTGTHRSHTEKLAALPPRCDAASCSGTYVYEAGTSDWYYYQYSYAPAAPPPRGELPSGGVWSRSTVAPAGRLEEEEVDVPDNDPGGPPGGGDQDGVAAGPNTPAEAPAGGGADNDPGGAPGGGDAGGDAGGE